MSETELSYGPHQVISADDAEEWFGISELVTLPFRDFEDEQEQHLYEGGLHVSGDFKGIPNVPSQPYNVVVDGDLVVEGSIDWDDERTGFYIFVTGNVRCKSLILGGCAHFAVRGDLVVADGIHAHHASNGGALNVRGKIRAKVLACESNFTIETATQPEAIVCAGSSTTDCRVDVDLDRRDTAQDEIFAPEVLRRGRLDVRAMKTALDRGHEVFLPGAVSRHGPLRVNGADV